MFVSWFIKCLGRFPSGGVPGYWHWFFATACLGAVLVGTDPMYVIAAVRNSGLSAVRFLAVPIAFSIFAIVLYARGYEAFRKASSESALASLGTADRALPSATSTEGESRWVFRPVRGLLWTIALTMIVAGPFILTNFKPKHPEIFVLGLLAALIYFSFEKRK